MTTTTTTTGILSSILRDERTVLIGLGVTAASFVCAMRFALEYYRDEVEIKPTQPKTQYITQDTEDSLKKGTLETLLQHYNFSIRETALKIVAGRAVNDKSAVEHLLWGITRPEYDERERCLKALAFAVEDVETYQDPLSVLNTPRGYSALVRSLELSLSDYEHEPLDDPLYDEYYLRDVNERRCLLLIYKLIHKYGVDQLIEARFIERWLAQQPWTRPNSSSSSSDPNPKAKANSDSNPNHDDNSNSNNNTNTNNDKDNDDDNNNNSDERLQNFARYLERKRNRISDICQHLTETRAGRRALVRARLLAKSKSKRPRRRPDHRGSEHIKVVLEINMGEDDENGNGNALRVIETSEAAMNDDQEQDQDQGGRHLVPRVVDQSAEEQRLRRRHREAMVLNDGTHPPGYGDIIEREHDSNG